MELILTAAEVLFATESLSVLELPTITVPKFSVALATPTVPLLLLVLLLCPVRAMPPHPLRGEIAQATTRVIVAIDKTRVNA
jgi:hypothetical protein